MTEKVVAYFATYTKKKVGNTHMHVMQCSTFDKKTGYLTSYDNYTFQKNADKPRYFKNKFSLQLYSAKELETILAKHGFEVIEQHSMDGSSFVPLATVSILTVVRKKAVTFDE